MREGGDRTAAATTATPAATASTSSTSGRRPIQRKQLQFAKNRTHVNGIGIRHHPYLQDPHGGLILHSSHQHERDPSTLANFCQSMLRISSLHVLQSAGYDAVHSNPLSVLADCLGRYLEYLAESAKEFAELSGRSQITAFDMVDGLSDVGIDLLDLKEWLLENGGEAIVTGKSPEEAGREETNTATTGPGTAAPNVSNRPALPSWKGADPGPVVNDLIWNGRTRSGGYKDTYEWHAVPVGFVMPETEDEQDEYAYPEASGDEDVYASKESEEYSRSSSSSSSRTRAGLSKWVSESKPPYIQDYMPPFPGSAVPDEETADEVDQVEAGKDQEQIRSREHKSSRSTDDYDKNPSSPAAASNTAGLDSAANVGDGSVQSDLAKLTINTIQPPPPSPPVVESVHGVTNSKSKADVNPYKHVVPFFESSLPFSTLYATIPPKSTSKSSSAKISIGDRPKTTGLSQEAQQLFSDTLMTLLDPSHPTSTAFPRRSKRQSRLALFTAKPGEFSDTLFSSMQKPGIIDGLLKASAPTAIANKFINPGVSVQEGLSPVLSTEKVMNGNYSDYASAEASGSGGRGPIVPGGSRKSSFSNSPLSTVLYPAKDGGVSTLNASMSGSTVKPKLESRKSSLTSTELIPGQGPQSHSLAALAPAAIMTKSTTSAAPINPSLLSRIGSNFDAAALLASQSSGSGNNNGIAATTGIPVPTVNGVPNSLTATSTVGPTTTIPPTSSTTTASITSSGSKNLAANKAASSIQTISSASVTTPSQAHTSTTAASAATAAPTAAPKSTTPAHPPVASKPIPRPISLSELPLSIPTSAAATAAIVSSPPPLKTPTPTTPSAPKIRFKFSAMDAISSSASSPSSSGGRDHDTSSSKRDGHGSSASSGHPLPPQHRSSSSSTSVSASSSHHKKHKKSSREYDFDVEDDVEDDDADGYSREKKKKKKSKSKDKDRDRERDRDRDRERDRDRDRDRDRERDRDRDRDRERDRERDRDRDRGRDRDRSRDRERDNEGSSRHKHHKHHKHHRHDSPVRTGIGADTNGAYATSKSSSSSSAAASLYSSSKAGYNYSAYPPPPPTAEVVDESAEVINCICAHPSWDDGLFMIACDKCQVWFHGRCVGVREGDVVGTWYCQRCTASGLV